MPSNVVNPNRVSTLTEIPCLHANGFAQVAQKRGERDGWMEYLHCD